MTERQQNLLFNIGLAAAGYFLVVKPVLEKIGILQTAAEREAGRLIDSAETGSGSGPRGNPFSPTYYKTRRCTILTQAYADSLARRIHTAMGLTDDEEAVFAVFRSLRTKCQVSFLAERFAALYKADLFQYLKQGDTVFWWGGLSDEDLAKIVTIVNSLPDA